MDKNIRIEDQFSRLNYNKKKITIHEILDKFGLITKKRSEKIFKVLTRDYAKTICEYTERDFGTKLSDSFEEDISKWSDESYRTVYNAFTMDFKVYDK